MKKISAKELEAEVRRLAKENPENRYLQGGTALTCAYASGMCQNGSIGCIFGQAFLKLGVSKEALQAIDSRMPLPETGAICSNGTIPHVLEFLEVEGVKAEFVYWCQSVQSAQDNEREWRNAIEYADEVADLTIAEDPFDRELKGEWT